MRFVDPEKYHIDWITETITFRDRNGIQEHELAAGPDDDVSVYREDGITYILALNRYLGYAGLQAFEGPFLRGEIFLQYDYELRSALNTTDLSTLRDETIARRLAPYVLQGD